MFVSPNDGGIVRINQSVPSSYPIYYFFEGGDEVRLEAAPVAGYRFDKWSGGLTNYDNPITVLMDCDKDVTAHFSRIVYGLTVQVSGRGAATPAVGTHSYGEGTVVDIKATPDSGWQFDGWSGDVAISGSATTTVTMDSAKTITANFSEKTAIQVSWSLVGGVIGGLILVGSLVAVLIVRRRV